MGGHPRANLLDPDESRPASRVVTEFEYFSAMIAVILALGVTHILAQVSALAEQRAKLYWVHVVWVSVTLLAHFSAWWNIWGFRESLEFSFLIFLYLLVGPTALFLAARAILPRVGAVGPVDLESHYYGVHGVFFTLMAVFVAWPSLMGSFVSGSVSMRGLVEHGLFMAPLICCAFSPNRRLHGMAAVLVAGIFLLVSLSWSARG